VTLIRGKHVLHFGGEYLIFEDNSTAWGNVNGATVSGIAGSADGDDNGFVTLFADAGGATNCDCAVNEIGVYQGGWNNTQQSNMVTNQRSGTFGWGDSS